MPCKECNLPIDVNKQFCNRACHTLYQRRINKVTHECAVCKEIFITQKSKKNTNSCSPKCHAVYVASKERNDKRMDTVRKNNLETYGVEYNLQRPDIKERAHASLRLRFATDSDKITEKRKKTKLERYGDENYRDEAKVKQTHMERYGVEYYNNSEKANQTKLEKYGTLDFSTKARATTLAKYGTLDFSDKVRHTKLEKYGSFSAITKRAGYNKLQEKYKDSVTFNFSVEEYDGAKGYIKYSFTCIPCGTVFDDWMTNGWGPICRVCHPSLPNNKSRHEYEIIDYLQSLGISNVIHGDRTVLQGKEIDIYLPDQLRGIELNGVYWHSEAQGKDQRYHLQKHIDAQSQGVRLVHIWDTEWIDKKDIVKSMLAMTLGHSTKLYGRKCTIREISAADTNNFLDANHLQGRDRASVRIGLFHQHTLVSVMTFTKSRFNKSYQWEISRYCTVLHTSVIGGAQKLFQYFVMTYAPDTIITYSDRRLFTGDIYTQLGFTRLVETSPSYFYTKDGRIFNRLQFQKHKLATILPIFDPALTEWENMKQNGYSRIWDCGHHKFAWANRL